jgi:squalene-associated FAD-dependent desaturase
MPDIAPSSDRPKAVVIGGGLAGLAAASVLAPRGFDVTLLESRPRLGGRASSIVDRETGRTIDNCQHVTMGCCTSFRHFCETTGCADLFETQRTLYFVEPPVSGRAPRIVPFRGIPLPAPAHLSLALVRMPWFSFGEKRSIARGLRALSRDRSSEADHSTESFAEWLTRHRQPEIVQSRFWHTVLVSALSESLDRVSVRHARKVFVDGFLSNQHGWEVSIPTAPLGEIYDDCIARSLSKSGVDLKTGTGVKRILLKDGRAFAAELRDGSLVIGDEFVLAVPHWLCGSLLPDELLSSVFESRTQSGGRGSCRAAHANSNARTGSAGASPSQTASLREAVEQIETAPIASAHLWFDRPLTTLSHATLLDRTSQWFFRRSAETEADGSYYCQVVISAAGNLASRSEEEILDEVEAELKSVWPDASNAKRLHGRVITEHRAVFSPLPGVDQLRPVQQSPVENLQLAGDWTQTGWPATMEGAVRSGYLAAQNILSRRGESFELPGELPRSLLFRTLFS